MNSKVKKFSNSCRKQHALLVSAAVVLSVSNSADAESVPERGIIIYKYLDYSDSQRNLIDSYSGASAARNSDRIKVKANSLMVMTPVAGEWSVSGTFTEDAISGASPGYHSKRLKKLEDKRHAESLTVTRYLPRGTISLGLNHSKENDYISKGFSILGTLASEDKNTTLNAGVGFSNDDIKSSDHTSDGRHVADWLVGLTQVMGINDIAQINLGYSDGQGYYSDPYKSADRRPESRKKYTLFTRWNHYFDKTGGSSHLSYRYYQDSFDIKAHTLNLEYTQPFLEAWSVTPLIRFYTQTAANFYAGIDPSSPEFSGYASNKYLSLDQRLGEYGAITWGFKLTRQINPDWMVDFKYENYTQKESWALSGNGGGVNEPFYFTSFQIGISRKF
jgi:hypothetical protein